MFAYTYTQYIMCLICNYVTMQHERTLSKIYHFLKFEILTTYNIIIVYYTNDFFTTDAVHIKESICMQW